MLLEATANECRCSKGTDVEETLLKRMMAGNLMTREMPSIVEDAMVYLYLRAQNSRWSAHATSTRPQI